MSIAAQALADDQGKVTIWHVWPCHLYDHIDRFLNPMRCIHRSPEQRQSFFGNMSLAFARMAHGGGSVLHSSVDYPQPPSDGIWATIELPELTRREGPVDWLQKMRMHSAWPEYGNVALKRKWLASESGVEWLRRLRGPGATPRWEEIFWRRNSSVGGWGLSEMELRRRNDDDLLEEEKVGDIVCQRIAGLGFFDDGVAW